MRENIKRLSMLKVILYFYHMEQHFPFVFKIEVKSAKSKYKISEE